MGDGADDAARLEEMFEETDMGEEPMLLTSSSPSQWHFDLDPGFWTTGEGQRLAYSEMTDWHLENVVRFIKRRGGLDSPKCLAIRLELEKRDGPKGNDICDLCKHFRRDHHQVCYGDQPDDSGACGCPGFVKRFWETDRYQGL